MIDEPNWVPDHPRHGWACAAGLLAAGIVFLVYLPSLGNGFVNYDDYDYLVNNTHIRSLDAGFIRWAFGGFHLLFYIPLTWLSFALDYHFWGLDPWGFHFTNAILHACNTFWVTLLAISLFRAYVHRSGRGRGDFRSMVAAGFVAALFFGLHPLRVESVAWATERKDVLSAFFILPAMLLYVNQGIRCPLQYFGLSWSRRNGAIVVLFILSLLSKPIMVTFPLVLLILDWYLLGRIRMRADLKGALVDKIPLAVISASALLLVLASQLPEATSLDRVSIGARLFTASMAIVSYLWFFVWPAGLSPLYPHPGNAASWDDAVYVLSAVAVVAASVFCWRQARRGQFELPAAWAFYLVTLLPVLGLAQVGPQAMADRFTYIPSLGPALLLSGWIVTSVMGRGDASQRIRARGVLAGIVVTGVLVSWSAVTGLMIGVWRDSETLWTRVIQVHPLEVVEAYHHRSYYYCDRGEFGKALEDMVTCISVAEKTQPHHLHEAYLALGDILARLHRDQEAYDAITRAIHYAPFPTAEQFLSRADILQRLGRAADAEEDRQAAIRLESARPSQ